MDSYYENLIKKEVAALPDFFKEYLSPGFKPKKILNVFCGLANEEPALKKLYGESINLLSIDNSIGIENRVKKLKRTSFQRNDVTKINSYAQGTYDLVIARNISFDYENNDLLLFGEETPSFFSNLREYLTLDSILLVTTVNANNFDIAKNVLKHFDYQILTSERNKITIPSDRIGIHSYEYKDEYVIIANRLSQERINFK